MKIFASTLVQPPAVLGRDDASALGSPPDTVTPNALRSVHDSARAPLGSATAPFGGFLHALRSS
jgi:hypothetical protein